MRRFKQIALSIAILILLSLDVRASKFAQDAAIEFKKSSNYPCVNHFPCFDIHLDYPDNYASSPKLPWENIPFISNPKGYMEALRQYAAEGNIEVDWNLQKNSVRKWFHTPWMHQGTHGREPIRGLTQERHSKWNELSPQQTRPINNWAIGFYNDRGGYEFGRVWKNKALPNTSNVRFPLGTVSVKMVFTDATNVEAPYLQGAGQGLTWYAQIHRNAQPIAMRLLQVDIAVRDKNANSTTGWVFGTFMFDASKGNAHYWNNLVPVGLHWGNDTNLTREQYDSGKRPIEGWMNPSVARVFKSYRPPFGDFGYLGRVNGLIDSPLSSCLSCHSKAVATTANFDSEFSVNLSDMCLKSLRKGDNTSYAKIVDCHVTEDAQQRISRRFRNLKTGESPLPNAQSLDYSLQMANGVARWNIWHHQQHPNQFETPFSRTESLTLGRPVRLDGIEMQQSFSLENQDL